MKRSVIGVLFIIFVFALLIVACTSNKQVLNQQDISNEIKQAEQGEKKSIGSDLREASAKVEIKLWEDVEPVVGYTIDLLIKRFEKEYPNIRVERTHMEREGLRENIQITFREEKAPELIFSSIDNIGLFSIMGIAQPLEVLINEELESMYLENRLNYISLNNHIYGTADITGDYSTIIYNKNLSGASLKVGGGLTYIANCPFAATISKSDLQFDYDKGLGINLLPRLQKSNNYAQTMSSGNGYMILANLSKVEQIAALKFIVFTEDEEVQEIIANSY